MLYQQTVAGVCVCLTAINDLKVYLLSKFEFLAMKH